MQLGPQAPWTNIQHNFFTITYVGKSYEQASDEQDCVSR